MTIIENRWYRLADSSFGESWVPYESLNTCAGAVDEFNIAGRFQLMGQEGPRLDFVAELMSDRVSQPVVYRYSLPERSGRASCDRVHHLAEVLALLATESGWEECMEARELLRDLVGQEYAALLMSVMASDV